MKKNQVIRKNHEFQDIINKRKHTVSKYLVIYEIPNDTNLRVGISISKKFANAVYRNRYRRQVRAILDTLQPWELKKDIVVMLRRPFLELSFSDKTKELKKLFERIS